MAGVSISLPPSRWLSAHHPRGDSPAASQPLAVAYPLWEGGGAGAEIRFLGRPRLPEGSVLPGLEEALAGLPSLMVGELPADVVWARQIHSDRVLRVGGGTRSPCGEGDALYTAVPDVALAVVTADCVPVLLAGGGRVAAVHAGWRGLAAGVIGATIKALGVAPGDLEAWIGPAIGPCCYEVGHEVVAQVERAVTEAFEDAGREVLSREEMAIQLSGRRSKPHLDLHRAAEHQLAAGGVESVRTYHACTRCHPEWLASYRRDGKGAGRNIALIWKSGPRASGC